MLLHKEGEEAQEIRWVPSSSRSSIQAPDFRFMAPSSTQRCSALWEDTCLPAHLAQPGLSGLSWRFGIKDPNSSCLIWTALDSSCLKASRVGKGADLLECCPALPFTGNLLFPPLVSPTLRREGSVSNPAPGAQLGFAGGLAVSGPLHHFLRCECQGLGLQERCSLLGRGEGAN